MKKLVLIDGHAILHRAYHALPSLTTSDGKIVNAVYGFVSMLIRVISDLKPTHLAVVFDRPEPTFRKKLYEDYQAQRPEADKEFISQIDLIKKVLSDFHIPVFEKKGFEADDVIGTISKKAKTDKVVIVTGDRDILQLIDNKVNVYIPIKGLSKSKMFNIAQVRKKFGLSPLQIVDYKALVGDPSDNYPGVSGIGPKTAQKLLSTYNSLEEIYKNLDKLDKESLKNKLKYSRKEAELSYKLAQIVTDVPVEFELENCQFSKLNTPQAQWTLEELEFNSLVKRLKKLDNKNSSIEKSKKNNKKEKNKSKQTSLF